MKKIVLIENAVNKKKMKKKSFGPLSHYHMKNNSKNRTDLNIGAKIIKLLELNIRIYVHGPRLNNEVVSMRQKYRKEGKM